jgi:hypothetical protein
MNATNDTHAAVSRGAGLLDRRDIFWPWKVDVTKLAIWRSCDCVLGQLFGHYLYGMGHLFLNEKHDDSFIHGFHGGDGGNESLNAAWLNAITARRVPRRVVVSGEGEAVLPYKAQQMGVVPDVVFVRKDGWTLGAPARWEQLAYKMWADEWVLFMRIGDGKARPIAEYEGGSHVGESTQRAADQPGHD